MYKNAYELKNLEQYLRQINMGISWICASSESGQFAAVRFREIKRREGRFQRARM